MLCRVMVKVTRKLPTKHFAQNGTEDALHEGAAVITNVYP